MSDDDPACTMFSEGFNEDDTLGMTYFTGYINGEELGQQNCIDGEDHHDYAPIN